METAKLSVYLITKPQLCSSHLNQFLHDENLGPITDRDFVSAGEMACEVAGRLCYMSYGKGRKTNEEFIKHIIEVGHGSVLEHANYGFIITGISRSCTHELVRHRHLSYSQLSQRYVDESNAKVVLPDPVVQHGSMAGTTERLIDSAKTAYRILQSNLEDHFRGITEPTARRKAARQLARCVLPNATETKIFVTGNARAWRHFIEMRGSEYAEPEIRNVAVAILVALRAEAPNFFDDYKIENGIIVPGHKGV